MKYIYTSLTLALALFLFAGCGDAWLDDMSPSTSVETPESLNTDTEVDYALNGIYTVLRDYHYYGARYTYYGDVTGEDMQARGNTKRVAKYYLFQLTGATTPSSFWSYPYLAIRNANNIITYANDLPENEVSDALKHYKGEALTIRALSHFDLVKVYGTTYTKDNGASLGVPIVTEHLDKDARPARSTVAEVYTQVIKDLEDAANLLDTKKNDIRLNWYGNQLLLARAYLYMGNDEKAYKVSTNLIAKANTDRSYGLVDNDNFPEMWQDDSSPEYLFMLKNNAEEVSSSKEFIGNLASRKGYDDLSLSSDYINLLDEDPDDVRHKIVEKYKPADYRWYTMKYRSPDYKYSNIPVLRLAEAYLIAAESAVKLNDKTNAAKYLNSIVQRANPDKEVEVDDVTIDRVLIERRKELVGEGHRLFDAMRNNQTIERKGASHNSDLLLPETMKYDWNYFKTILAIPQSEINLDGNKMEQNEGYGI